MVALDAPVAAAAAVAAGVIGSAPAAVQESRCCALDGKEQLADAAAGTHACHDLAVPAAAAAECDKRADAESRCGGQGGVAPLVLQHLFPAQPYCAVPQTVAAVAVAEGSCAWGAQHGLADP